MKKIVFLTSCMLSLAFLPACFMTDPVTGKRVFDEEKTEDLKDLFKIELATEVTRLVSKNPDYADPLNRFDQVLCAMRDNENFNPEYLVAELDQAIIDHDLIGNTDLVRVKNILVGLYRIQYRDRLEWTISPEKWLYHVTDLLCESIRTGLKDAGIDPVSIAPHDPAYQAGLARL